MTSIKDKVLVDINVGGHTYTSSLSTLTKYPDSQLGKMFEESIPVTVYNRNNSHFIDRDGRLFCYVLNFLRIGELCLPDSFDEFDLLLKECQYYDIKQLTEAVKELREKKKEKALNVTGNSNEVSTTAVSHYKRGPTERKYDCVTLDAIRLNVMGNEMTYITASKDVIIEIFPEVSARVNQSHICPTIGDYVLRVPLDASYSNGRPTPISVEIFERLLNSGFQMLLGSVCGPSTSWRYILSRSV